jgi:uncharacterized protein
VIRAVVDPGVLIAALIAPAGTCANILRAWQDGVFQLVVSPRLLDELRDVLLRPKFRRWMNESDAVTFVELLRLAADVRPDTALGERISRDEGDDYLIRLFASSRSTALVSGDGDLVSFPFVLTPARFLELLDEVRGAREP